MKGLASLVKSTTNPTLQTTRICFTQQHRISHPTSSPRYLFTVNRTRRRRNRNSNLMGRLLLTHGEDSLAPSHYSANALLIKRGTSSTPYTTRSATLPGAKPPAQDTPSMRLTWVDRM